MRNLIQPALRYLLAWSLAFVMAQLPHYLPAQVDAAIAGYLIQHDADRPYTAAQSIPAACYASTPVAGAGRSALIRRSGSAVSNP
ncbi:hypothetical protein [Pseudoxanthomonas gei]|uniref:hypothetical protein n=1 Tax=Pseudoxanthomonas gei TaxID=1383030 RepID=UPI001391950A|nr:hypothetical protein [Pseudoxanthomonas gei]